MKKIKVGFFAFIFTVGIFLFSPLVSARENVANWYIRNFETEIVVNKDSSLDITEKITADCGKVSGKHGIFRILPEEIKLTNGKTIKTPAELLSITDFDGRKLKYSQLKSRSDKTVNWKIGDPNVTVQGVNYYKIHYRVENAVRFASSDFNEFYWNLNGNFWNLEADAFQAKIIFPNEVREANSQVDFYTGELGSKSKNLATYRWSASNVLEFNSTKTLFPGQGITASVIFPKGIFTPHHFGFFETYGKYLWLIIPILIFFTCFYFWQEYGKDPRIKKTVIAEYDVPGKLSPLELGMLMKNGKLDNKFVTAEIINLAVKGFIKIKELDNKVLVFHIKDHEFERTKNAKEEEVLNEQQKKIVDKIFFKGNKVKLSSLKNNFHTILKEVRDETNLALERKGLIVKSGTTGGG